MNDWVNVYKEIFKVVFNREIEFSLDEIRELYAFDLMLPHEVKDSSTGELGYSVSNHFKSYMTSDNVMKRDYDEGWMLEKQEICSLEDIIKWWESINYASISRSSESENVLKSDLIYSSNNIYNSLDIINSKYMFYSFSCVNSERLIASSRSNMCTNSIRCDDSKNCSNSYNVIYSNKVINSYFIQDCFDLYECMFCSHIASCKYCIANMQFSEEEYFQIKEKIIDWILRKNNCVQ